MMDLSRNRLGGIEPLLRVPAKEPPKEKDTTVIEGSSQEQVKDTGGETPTTRYTYPLAGLLELRLNGCVKALPPCVP